MHAGVPRLTGAPAVFVRICDTNREDGEQLAYMRLIIAKLPNTDTHHQRSDTPRLHRYCNVSLRRPTRSWRIPTRTRLLHRRLTLPVRLRAFLQALAVAVLLRRWLFSSASSPLAGPWGLGSSDGGCTALCGVSASTGRRTRTRVWRASSGCGLALRTRGYNVIRERLSLSKRSLCGRLPLVCSCAIWTARLSWRCRRRCIITDPLCLALCCTGSRARSSGRGAHERVASRCVTGCACLCSRASTFAVWTIRSWCFDSFFAPKFGVQWRHSLWRGMPRTLSLDLHANVGDHVCVQLRARHRRGARDLHHRLARRETLLEDVAHLLS